MANAIPLKVPVEDLTAETAAEALAWLAAEMARHDALYNEATPEISDADYDALRALNLAIVLPDLIRSGLAVEQGWSRRLQPSSPRCATACPCCRWTTLSRRGRGARFRRPDHPFPEAARR